nr:flagellar hook-basal body complex protein FliE [Micavibrio aeruginosavorus]
MVNSVASPAMAANAYANMAKTASGAGVAAEDGAVSFGSMIEKAATESIATMKNAETVQAQAIIGKAGLADVVEAVTAAELTLQSVVAVRDRMINAYQEIMRMPI